MLYRNPVPGWLRTCQPRSPRGPRPKRAPSKLRLESLEDRTVPSPLQAGTVSVHATEGLLYNGPVTTFTDGNAADTAANFTATITWGDNTTSAGTVTGSGGKFTVSGQHTYAAEGNFPMSVLIQEDNGDSVTAGGPPRWTQLAAGLPATGYGGSYGPALLAATGGADGKIYALGGQRLYLPNAFVVSAEVDVYDPSTQTWSVGTPLPLPLEYLAATTGTDGTIYAVGGISDSAHGNAGGVLEAYNPSTQTWTQLPPVPGYRFNLGATTGADGKIYAIGGVGSTFSSEVDAYDPTTNTWTQLPSLPTARSDLAAATGADGTIYAIGGYNYGGVSNEVDAYNPVTRTWTVLPALPRTALALGVTAGKDGTIYAIGGRATLNYPDWSSEVDAYDPASQTWTVMGSTLPTARQDLAAATGSDGALYALGGDNNTFPYYTNEVDVYPGKGANTAVVVDPAVAASGTTLLSPGLSVAGRTVATFTDPGGAEAVGNYSATIGWGDQSSFVAADNITYDPSTGTFSVLGSHTYSVPGPYTVSVTIQHDSAPTVTVNTAAQVGNLKPTPSITGPAAGVTGQSLTFTVSATDPLASLDAAGFTYSIAWGDGAQDTVPAAAGNGAGVSVSHAFAAGPYTVQVTATDQNGNSDTASLGVTISPANTSTALTSSSGSPYWGQNVTFTATVTPVAPGGGAPTGTVTFYDGNTVLGTGKLQVANGVDQAFLSTSLLEVGGHTITASYGGDPNFNGSNSGSVSETVSLATPVVTWANPADVVYGTALGSAQLDASANVAGSFTYTPGAGTVLHVGSGQVLSVVFTPADSAHYAGVTQSVLLNVTPATLTVRADDQSKVYGAPVPPLTASYSGFVNGDTPAVLTGSPSLATTPTQYSAPGPYAITVGLGSLSAADYSFNFVSGTLTVSRAATGTAFTLSATTPLAGDAVGLTATITITAPGSGTPTGSVDFFDTTAGQDLGSAPVLNGVAALGAGPFTAGTHALTATYSGDGNFLGSSGTASLTALAPASLSGTVFEDFNDDGQVDFGENGIAGVTITLTGTDDLGHGVNLSQTTDGDGADVFLNLRPGSYTISETQPGGYTQGINTVGTAGGTVVNDQFFVNLSAGVAGLNYNYGERPAATGAVQKGQTAGIGFWNNKNGQALILALNGGGSSHQLGDWLAATFVNLYGAKSGNDLTGESNADVASLFQQDFLQKGVKVDAQVLATALAVYATNSTLDSTQVATQYGFTVSGDGVGTATFNVGSDGDAFGVANNTSMAVLDLLLAADARAVNGVLYGGNATLRKEANDLFSALNQAGGIG